MKYSLTMLILFEDHLGYLSQAWTSETRWNESHCM